METFFSHYDKQFFFFFFWGGGATYFFIETKDVLSLSELAKLLSKITYADYFDIPINQICWKMYFTQRQSRLYKYLIVDKISPL